MLKLLYPILALLLSACSQDWSYSGANLPQNWGNIKEEYKFCKIGSNQSPIDVTSEFKDNDLIFSYNFSEIDLKPERNFVKLSLYGKDFVKYRKKKYDVRYIEFHHPSEHLINGNAESLEMVIFHKSGDEQWLALTIFFELGQPNSEVATMIKLLQNGSTSNASSPRINLAKIVNFSDKIFFYDGSLTTPPCTEGIKRYILETPVAISKEQMDKIIKLAITTKDKFNARPVMPFNPSKY